MKIINTKNSYRCEICHQTDKFDSNVNKCNRCSDLIIPEFENKNKKSKIVSNNNKNLFSSVLNNKYLNEDKISFLRRLAIFFTCESILLIISFIFISNPFLIDKVPTAIMIFIFILALPALIPEILIIISIDNYGSHIEYDFGIYTLLWVIITIALWKYIQILKERENII